MSGRRGAFETGGWRVEPSRCVLMRGGEQIRIEPKVMDVLVCLAGRKGEVVSKDELIREVWEGRFVSDEVITVAVSELRKALGDNARQPVWVETIPRRGYRWIPAVGEAGAAQEAAGRREKVGGKINWKWAAAAMMVIGLASWQGATWMGLGRGAGKAAGAEQRDEAAEIAYRKARHYLEQFGLANTREALKYFEEAVKRDPGYAEAYAGMADAYIQLAEVDGSESRAHFERARDAAERALRLRPNIAQAHAALGMVRLLREWDVRGAEAALKRAIALEPKLVSARRSYATLHSARGQHEEAIQMARRVVDLDPVSPRNYVELAWAMNYAGRFEEALVEIERGIEMDRGMFGAYVSKAMTLEITGEPAAAYAALQSGYYRVDRGPEIVAIVDKVYRREGMKGVYGMWLAAARQGAPHMPQSEMWQAQLLARMGEREDALAALERAYEKREGSLLWAGVNPLFGSLRSEARFQRIVERVAESSASAGLRNSLP